MSLRITSLGTGTVKRSGLEVNWPSTASRHLFFLLLSHPQGYSRSEIIQRLSLHADADGGRNHFKVTLYRLRRALGDPAAVVEQDHRYRLAERYHERSDLHLYREALRAGKRAETREERLRHYAYALSLYAGDFLPENPAEWAEEVRTSLYTAHVRTLLEVAFLHCDGLECHAAVRHLAGALNLDPLLGENYQQDLITCLCLTQDEHSAVTHYRRYLRFIQHEIGDSPMPGTVDLVERIKQGQPYPARHIGSSLPCPRRALAGAILMRKVRPPNLDLPALAADLARSHRLLGLVRRLSSSRSWKGLAGGGRGFLVEEVGAGYAGVLPYPLPETWPTSAAHPALPPDVQAAAHAALTRALGQPAGETGPAPEPGPPLALETVVDGTGAPIAAVYAARPAGSGDFGVTDRETVGRVASALGHVLAQPRWHSLSR
ncbi:AfsR/SARP family transcriptional regulator [Deinococcus planocerae]|uniref:AfsR/SARP family transcriptional regulator n=1 Tax=Deinococcus planocerae TaxID=1737569 RepID=UPI000C7EE663|nr:BTAD domain-containing putative transcriptional regulator [Deinococcus planocerae]